MMLTKADRCDACSAQALVVVQMVSGVLLFCGHHFRKHEERLRWEAVSVDDRLLAFDD